MPVRKLYYEQYGYLGYGVGVLVFGIGTVG